MSSPAALSNILSNGSQGLTMKLLDFLPFLCARFHLPSQTLISDLGECPYDLAFYAAPTGFY